MTEAVRARPQIDDLGFDPRLMSAEKLLRLAGKAGMKFSDPGPANLYLDCEQCGKAIENLTDRRGGAYRISAMQLLANVLRHLVLRHNLSLAGGNDDGGGDTGPGLGGGRDAGDSVHAGERRRGRPGHRPAHQEGDPAGSPGASGGGGT